MKRKGMFLLIGLIFWVFLMLISSASAINLEIDKETINEVIIAELDNPAVFEFTIKNLGETDTFEIYSLVGVNILPRGTFSIKSGGTKKIKVEVKAGGSVKKNLGYFNFVYKIKGSNTGIQEDRLTIRIVNLKDALELWADEVEPNSNKVAVYIQNKERFDFESIEAEFSSVFFKFEKSFALKSLEKKSFIADLNKGQLEILVAGPYILSANIKSGDAEETLESTIKFLEKSGLSTEERKEGVLIVRQEIEKKNEGNTIAFAEVTVSKNIISRLFTNFNINPSKAERKGSVVLYTWQQELRPNESLKIIARTNWYTPIIIIIAIVIITVFVQVYFISDIILKKKINFVKTKGGEFALKVSIKVKGRRFVERTTIIDKLPPIVKLYGRYGTITPDRVDEKNRRIEWSIESLDKGEEAIFTYIIYSKIGIMGRFELPPAKAIYEREGKIKETSSNKVFFISEARKLKKDKGERFIDY